MPTIEFTGPDATSRVGPVNRALVRAAVAARCAPSLFNSQPWCWRIAADVAELRADREHQLHTIDPDGRLLMISCGAALHHAWTALAGVGAIAEVLRAPDPADPDLLARIRVTGFGTPSPAAVRRQQTIALRRTDRRPFADSEVPAPALDALRAAAEANGAHLYLLRPEDVVTLTVAAAHAGATEFADPAFRAELAAWSARPSDAREGVPASSGGPARPRPVPVRDFTLGAPPARVGTELADRYARYTVLFTDADTPASWLAAGEALSAVLLTATTERLAASPMSDVAEVPAARQLLRDLLSGIGYPALALRVGVPADGWLSKTRRRPAADTVHVSRLRRTG